MSLENGKMRNHFLVVSVGLAVITILSPALFAQSVVPRGTEQKTPDLSGVWIPGGGMMGGVEGRGFRAQVPPLQPTAMEVYEANRKGLTGFGDKGLDELDPNTYCYPPGAPRSMVMPYPFEIVQRPGVVYIFFEYGSGVRRIFTDGRKHPADAEATWMGHSIGAWQGDTLVVDTVALRPETWLDPLGTPHSDALHMVERFRRTGPAALNVEFRFDDSKTFTMPWGGTRVYQATDAEISEYFVCEEDLQMGKPRTAQ
jgi:hypothetical protein